jgi:phospholipase/lecithinase/hemolysin
MRLISIAIASAISTATLLFAAGAACAGPFDRLWVFGDSTVDTGWYNFRPSGESQFDQYLSSYNLARPPHFPPTYGIGKPTSSPGPVSVEVLAALTGTDVLPADAPLTLGEADPNFHALIVRFPLPVPIFIGTNYATGGARNHDVNTPTTGLFPNAVPTETQIANYLGQHEPDGQSLYLISSGGNDVGVANLMNNPTAYLTGVADSLAAAILTLQQRGARYIIVTDLPESFGTAEEQSFRHLYNTELMSQLTALGVNFAWGDMNGLRQQIVANPASFGITHTTNSLADRACTTPDPSTGIISAWAYLCSPISPVSKPISETFAEQALFADNEHWATGGQKILGTYYFCLAARTWPRLFFPFGHIPPVAVLPPPCGGNAVTANAP